ncbi:hypothetical protein R6Q57_024816 [Mikania cordata]
MPTVHQWDPPTENELKRFKCVDLVCGFEIYRAGYGSLLVDAGELRRRWNQVLQQEFQETEEILQSSCFYSFF